MKLPASMTFALLCATFALVTVNFYGIFKPDHRAPQNPITIVSMELVSKKVELGGDVIFDLTVKKDRQCPAYYHYEFVNPGGELLRGYVQKGGSFPVSGEPETRRFRARLPDLIWPDTWTMTVPGWVACHDGTWPVIHPPLTFEVTDD